jgi:hypothetical protein
MTMRLNVGMSAGVGMLAAVAVMAVAVATKVGPSSGPVRAEESPRFDDSWRAAAVPLALKKADMERMVQEEPRKVKTVPVVEPMPTIAPEPVMEEKEVRKRSVRSVLHEKRHAPRDICTRHKMRKVITRGGKSWRCKK